MMLSAPLITALLAGTASAHIAIASYQWEDTTTQYPHVYAPMAAVIDCPGGVNSDNYEAGRCAILSGWRLGDGHKTGDFGNGYRVDANGGGRIIWKDGRYVHCGEWRTTLEWKQSIAQRSITHAYYLCTMDWA
ncbi:hypothetical protein BJ508DRAFT_311541 [Ascobolus immersus RN42]|uniref:Uncharacterized protein n=1 Tax=Ascobolus immersus RN42 TaxID=1160509 RepID=A0A3N4HQ18_ASCIM|nr:hypothetical protein BJ508DRAFT_311541 [Ascobolus immersus RN42]